MLKFTGIKALKIFERVIDAVFGVMLLFIVDAGIVFVLREIMIKLFEHRITPEEIYALSVLLLVLGGLRIGSILVFQREKAILEHATKRARRRQKPPNGNSPVRLIRS